MPIQLLDMSDCGWLYVFENEAMPGYYKIGMTTRSVEERFSEENSSRGTYGLPLPYTVALSRHVCSVSHVEKELHDYLTHNEFRPNIRRKFFNCPIGELEVWINSIPECKCFDEKTSPLPGFYAFVDEHIVRKEDAEVRVNDILVCYKEWCKKHPQYPCLQRVELIDNINIVYNNNKEPDNGRIYRGIKLT